MASAENTIPDTQLGLTNDEIALLRHHQQAAASTAGGSSSRAASRASSQGLLLLDGSSLAQLGRHFDRLLQQIQARLDYLSEQSQMVAQQQYDRAGNPIAIADNALTRFHEILRQIDELEVDFDRIRHIRDIVRGYRQRVEEMDHESDQRGRHHHRYHGSAPQRRRNHQKTPSQAKRSIQEERGVKHSFVSKIEEEKPSMEETGLPWSTSTHSPSKELLDLKEHARSVPAPQFLCVFSFAGCQSRFATKIEWKNHVSSQHLNHVPEHCQITVEGITLEKLGADEQDGHPFVKWALKERIIEREYGGGFRLCGINGDRGHQYDEEKKVASSSDNPTGTFSDSGYASMGRNLDTKTEDAEDDTRSVCTDGQEVHIEEEAKAKLVSTFSSETIKHLYSTLVKLDSKKSVARLLVDLLKEFSIRLQYDAKPGPQKDTSVFIRHCRQ
jgi:hypothetical protein